MSQKIRWGILGCGKIAKKFASDLKLVHDGELKAVASRDAVRLSTFANEYGAPLSFDSYEALVACADVDAIYVATPHGFHYDHVMLCLQHRKAVLCEKAFALNLAQARSMVEFARKQRVFLMEAFWTKFLPQYHKVMEIINSGEIGEVKMIQSDFGFKAPEPRAQRLYDPILGGGSLLDIGIYPIFMAQSILGKPTHVHAFITAYESGVDEQCVMTMKFAGGALAVLSSTFAVDTPVEAMIAGTEGRIVMRNRFHNAMGTVEVVIGRSEPRIIEVHREDGFGYQFEIRHVNECLKKGLTESPVMTHADTLMLMETLDRVRTTCDVRYSVDV
ncbi:MAG TPA: Gfo/Idh/MocA family oxidoreductase [Chryseosolibacter sp.]|nr:Gfo/Idh/MocA family oxidoreductase [Chryseosolibacter sp.]